MTEKMLTGTLNLNPNKKYVWQVKHELGKFDNSIRARCVLGQVLIDTANLELFVSVWHKV